jgi:hypothetical protein
VPGYTRDLKGVLDKYEAAHKLPPGTPLEEKPAAKPEPDPLCVICGGSGKISATATIKQDRKLRAMGVRLEGRICSACNGTGKTRA